MNLFHGLGVTDRGVYIPYVTIANLQRNFLICYLYNEYISAITSWQINGETMETVTDFIFLGSKITADGDCSHEIKRCLVLGRKAVTNLDSILKSREITLPIKVHLVKAMVFPVAVYRCESWTMKKVEHQRTGAVMLDKTLESPLDCKEIKPMNCKGSQS